MHPDGVLKGPMNMHRSLVCSFMARGTEGLEREVTVPSGEFISPGPVCPAGYFILNVL